MLRNDDAAVGVSILMIIQLILSRLSIFISAYSPFSAAGHMIYVISYLLPVFIYIRFFRRKESQQAFRISHPLPPFRDCVLYIIAALSVTMLAVRVNALFISLLAKAGAYIKMPDLSPSYGVSGVFFTIISLVFMPAILEELLCRFAIMEQLLPFGKVQAAVVSGILFGLMHANLSQIIYAAAAGFVIGYFVAHTRSLPLGMLIHAIINAYAVAMFYAESIIPKSIFPPISFIIEITIIILGLFSFSVIYKSVRKNKITNNEKAENEGGSAAPARGKKTLMLMTSPWIILYAAAALTSAIHSLS